MVLVEFQGPGEECEADRLKEDENGVFWGTKPGLKLGALVQIYLGPFAKPIINLSLSGNNLVATSPKPKVTTLKKSS